MSKLSFLERLLDGASLEWKPMSVVAEVRSGWGFPRAYQGETEGSCPFYKVSDMNLVGNETTMVTANNYIDDATAAKLGVKPAPAGTIIFPKIGAAIATNKKRLLSVPSAYDNNVMGLIPNEKVVSRFLFHWMQIVNLSSLASDSGAVPSIRKSDMEKLSVPIPSPEDPDKSLVIQAEIVRILDSFTELTAELTAELKARKQQYNHYREQLLDYEGKDVEHLPMGDERVGSFTRGGGLQKKDFAESGVGCIHYGQIYTHYGTYAHTTKSFVSEEFAKKARMAKPGDLVIATTSENDEDVCKAVAWLGDEDIAVSSDACFYSHKLNPKFVAYFFQTEQFQKQKRVHITGAKVRRVNADNLAKILIPVPSAEEQDRVVEILDKFDTLTTSLSEGLPREIKLRQQQYEYYRDLLLSFPKPEEAA
ncbi:restriction endonuclease subunit S [Shimia marina]|uniref:Type I restriction enzyme specificity protein MPN_089 n=1 Tax=Shimia marina TaxID=321267 RepID=A0A0P1FCP2_9RHOB|nr:restriction endonuclease subunit S [Shimia marina]CUH51702.1 Type I restriction enzyme specificity protein MPN_089 [Shimia marina]SFE69810.1 type I restriction enzyme, S subunit [Shimia marina]